MTEKSSETQRQRAEEGPKQLPAEEIALMLGARFALLWVVTQEELRSEREIAAAAQRDGWTVRYWDCASGAQDVDLKPVLGGDGKPLKSLSSALGAIGARKASEVWILRDADAFLRAPGVGIEATRAVKSLARQMAAETRIYRNSQGEDELLLGAVIILTSSGDIPESLRPVTTVYEWPLPTREQISREIGAAVAGNGGTFQDPLASIVEAAAGLPMNAVEDATALALRRSGSLAVGHVASFKRRLIERERVLSWHDPDPRGLDAVGGLGRLKRWLVERRQAMSPEARAYGLKAPRGVLLAGIPGCGKSLVRKAIAASWGIPLLELDLGALKGRYVGQSEERIRQALKTAQAVAPVVLGLEEIEKALAGATGLGGDSGVSKDQLGVLLTWLQEHEGAVFLVATANDCTSLPPELLRKGRFDEAFFVDLPQHGEREEILSATIRKTGRDPEAYDLAAAASASADFSGAELASAWEDRAMLTAFNANREPVTEDLLGALAGIRPGSASDKVRAYREWGTANAVPASDPEDAGTPATAGFRRLAN